MIKQVVCFVSLCVVLFSCNNTPKEQALKETANDSLVKSTASGECEKLYAQAKASDEILMRALTLDKTVATKAINDFNAYASNCKTDSLAPVFLIKAGQVAQAIGSFTQAQAMLNKCINEHTQFKNREAAIFLLAQLYDDPKMLNNEEEAKKLYEQVISEYPKTSYATDSRAAIQNLGKTDEQLIQEFLKKKQ